MVTRPSESDTNNDDQDETRTNSETTRLSERCAILGICTQEEADRILRETNDDFNTKEVIYVKGKPMIHGSELCALDETDIEIHSGMPIRLSKRMSELGMCSRREAAAILREASECRDESSLKYLKQVIYLRGKPVMGGAAVKIPPGEKYIQIRAGNDPPNDKETSSKDTVYIPYADRPWDEIKGDTIVLHKPIGYVSGQEEHQHVPAVRLLTRSNIHLNDDFEENEQREFKKGSSPLHYDRWKFTGFEMKANSVPKHIRDTFSDDKLNEKSRSTAMTLSGYAPAGRLDIDSTGILLFTRAGIMARRLIEPKSKIPKEYIVKVEPAVQPTSREFEMGLTRLPSPTRDLSVLLKKGNRLWMERNTLKPLLEAEWLVGDDDDDIHITEQGRVHQRQQTLTMRLVMVEGKKRQIRRMCREILGWHVVELVRTSVGPVQIDSLPEGKWRPLTQEEVKSIFEEQSGSQSKAPPPSTLDVPPAEMIAKLKKSYPGLPPEIPVMQAIKKALLSTEKKLTIVKLRKRSEQYLSFKPEKSGEKKEKWEQYFQHIVDNNQKHLAKQAAKQPQVADAEVQDHKSYGSNI
ncbi:hypothetical protein ACHAXR_011171 [Thalassiosira sp. AJA248-18]